MGFRERFSTCQIETLALDHYRPMLALRIERIVINVLLARYSGTNEMPRSQLTLSKLY